MRINREGKNQDGLQESHRKGVGKPPAASGEDKNRGKEKAKVKTKEVTKRTKVVVTTVAELSRIQISEATRQAENT